MTLDEDRRLLHRARSWSGEIAQMEATLALPRPACTAGVRQAALSALAMLPANADFHRLRAAIERIAQAHTETS